MINSVKWRNNFNVTILLAIIVDLFIMSKGVAFLFRSKLNNNRLKWDYCNVYNFR